MAHVINQHEWVLPTQVITVASRKATEKKLSMVYLSSGAKKDDTGFLFYSDTEQQHIAFTVDLDDE